MIEVLSRSFWYMRVVIPTRRDCDNRCVYILH